MLAISDNFTVKIEDFSAFRVDYHDPKAILQGYTGGKWIRLYVGPDVMKQKALLDEELKISNARECLN